MGVATIINLTPHTVTVRTENGDRSFPVSGQVARVSVDMQPVGDLNGIPVSRRHCGDVVGLPLLPAEDTHYIVSTMVFEASAAETARAEASLIGDGEFCLGARELHASLVRRHAALLVPDSGSDAVRENGQVVAVRRFIVA